VIEALAATVAPDDYPQFMAADERRYDSNMR
jgi:hypothetical protein